ncbi:MAG TPA: hypothetical protein VGL77_11800, partial [Armatimonadota bacterium]
MRHLAQTLLICGLLLMLCTAIGNAFTLTRALRTWDRHDVFNDSTTSPDLTGWAEFDVTVPTDGWYELFYQGYADAGWERSIWLDGQFQHFGRSLSGDEETPGS